ncbi:MAG: DUF885 family protein [Burkholderiales bacterium]
MIPRLVLAAALAAATLVAHADGTAPDAALHALFEREYRHGLEDNPERATMLGDTRYNGRLGERSPAAVARRKARVKAVLSELAGFDPARLSPQDRVSLEVLRDSLRRRESLDALYTGLPFGSAQGDGWLQVSPSWGPHALLAMLARAAPTRNAKDYEDYLERLGQVPRLLDESVALMRAGMRSGWMPPRAAMVRVPAQLAAFAGDDPAATPLYAPFRRFPQAMAAAERERLEKAGREVLAGRVHPAFAAFRRFVAEEYLPACREELAASTLPAGMSYYEQRVAAATTTRLTPREIHETGLAEVARIRAGMDAAIVETGFRGSFAQFLEHLRTDPRFYHESAEAMLMHYRDIAKRADAALPQLFAELPRLPYGIRPMAAHEGDNAEHYTRGALDGSRAGFFEANTNNLKRRPKHDMEAVLLHETVPGHHLQTARAQELSGLPAFRRASGFVAYGEGWALYAESLGAQMGLYRDPYSRFGRLSMEMWRACRLVVDTGLHAFGWTRERAIRYLADTAGIQESAAVAEVDRYILDPGQALGYKIGELRILALRDKARRALGEGFDLRRFHNAVLDDGPLPLDLLEARIDDWIAREKSASLRKAPKENPG